MISEVRQCKDEKKSDSCDWWFKCNLRRNSIGKYKKKKKGRRSTVIGKISFVQGKSMYVSHKL